MRGCGGRGRQAHCGRRLTGAPVCGGHGAGCTGHTLSVPVGASGGPQGWRPRLGQLPRQQLREDSPRTGGRWGWGRWALPPCRLTRDSLCRQPSGQVRGQGSGGRQQTPPSGPQSTDRRVGTREQSQDQVRRADWAGGHTWVSGRRAWSREGPEQRGVSDTLGELLCGPDVTPSAAQPAVRVRAPTRGQFLAPGTALDTHCSRKGLDLATRDGGTAGKSLKSGGGHAPECPTGTI